LTLAPLCTGGAFFSREEVHGELYGWLASLN
jgi:hypothetical protein